MNPDREKDIIAGCQKGEAWARRELYEKFSPSMLSLCVRYMGDAEAAKDVLQDGFVKVFTRFHTYQAKGPLGGWIRKIFVNMALEHLVRNKKMLQAVSVDEYVVAVETYEHFTLEKISAEDLIECISELPARCRTVFNMHAIEGYSHAEISEKLGIQEASSRVQFARARKQLQEMVYDLMRKNDVRKR